ncbi:hypothetical protein [Parvularcula marina]|uniref:hypothetical protein n=2 Tax=Parvularcula marina TaxID=2292771 RepID=UPI0035159F37
MPYFQVMLHATGIDVPDGKLEHSCIGFYTGRTVKAEDQTAAEHLAIASAMDEWIRCGFALRNRTDGVTYTAEDIDEISFMSYMRYRIRRLLTLPIHRGNHGATWYTEQ